MTLDETVDRMQELVKQCSPEGTDRDWALLREIRQVYSDYLDGLVLPPYDESVTVKMDGTAVKFQDADSFAEWAAERMHE